MSGARFARSGRCRFFVCLGVFVIMVLFVAIFHSSQLQLDDIREQRLRCEQNQEGLNEQLQTLLEQKFNLEKTHDSERKEQMEAKRNVEQKLKETNEEREKEQLQSRVRYEKLEQTFKLLQIKHDELEAESAKDKKQHLEDTNAFEKRLQALRSELQQDKSVQEGEMAVWKVKYNNLLREKELESNRIESLENTIKEYKEHCDYKPKEQSQPQINRPLNGPQTTRNGRSQAQSIDKPRNEKSFSEQVQIVPKSVNKISDEATAQQIKQEEEAVVAAPVAAALVADKMVSPLSAPRKPTSTDATKNAQAEAHLNQALNATALSSTSSNMPPLELPPKPAERKLPENVAPIPDNFDDLPQPNKVDPADLDTAAEDLRKNDNDEGKNNRYANVVNDLENGKQPKAANEDSGAHEVKDHDFLNEQNFNVPAEEDNHFFDAGVAAGGDKHAADIAVDKLGAGDNNDDDDDLMANDADGDVAVKPAQHSLDADNLNNEIAGDQGKEFPDGLRMDDVNEEDQDEDDYSNLAARKQGAEAIRN